MRVTRGFALFALLVVLVCVLACVPARAGERYAVAIIPFGDGTDGKDTDRVGDIAEAVTSELVETLGQYSRFDILSGTELLEKLTEAGMKPEDVSEAKLAEISEKLNQRIVIFGKVVGFSLEKKTEDMVLFSRRSLTCKISVRLRVYDRSSRGVRLSETLNAESSKIGTKTEIERSLPTPKQKGRVVEDAVRKVGATMRRKLLKLYEMTGKVTATEGKKFTLNIGRDFGVQRGYYFAVFEPGAAKRSAVLVVVEVDEHSSKADLYQNKGDVKVGARVVRLFKR